MTLRGHEPVIIDEFNGLWDRGDRESTPLDHFQDCENLKFIGSNSITTRDGIGISQSVATPLSNVKRIYNYPTQTSNTLIVLTYDNNTNMGSIYHVVSASTVFGPLLTKAGMTDFAFVPYAGRGYISPFTTYVVGSLNQEKGLQSEFLYVYMGDGTAARKAAGAGPSGTLTVANGAAGHTDMGFHVFAAVFEYNSGYLSPPAAFKSFSTSPLLSLNFSTIPTSGSATVTKVHIVATKKITSFNGDLQGYQFFFIPNAFVTNGTTTLNGVSFYDADLLDDASHLLDNYTEIPAGAVLCMYNNRLCLSTTYTDISLILVSAPGEPEAIDQINGIMIMPLDGNPITNLAELRDVLYAFKRSRVGAFTDNEDEPATWPYSVIDTALGTCVHGIATVLDSGGSSIDYLIICNFAGVSIFNGKFITPELSWKIENRWRQLDRDLFGLIQIINAPIQKWVLIVTPDDEILMADYANGLDPKKIRWMPWTFPQGVNTVAIFNIDEIVIGSDIQ